EQLLVEAGRQWQQMRALLECVWPAALQTARQPFRSLTSAGRQTSGWKTKRPAARTRWHRASPRLRTSPLKRRNGRAELGRDITDLRLLAGSDCAAACGICRCRLADSRLLADSRRLGRLP